MGLPSIDKALHGDVTKAAGMRLKGGPATDLKTLVDQRGGRPRSEQQAMPATPEQAIAGLDPAVAEVLRRAFVARRSRDQAMQIAALPDAGDEIKVLAQMSAINDRAAWRQAREVTAWEPEQ